MKAYTNSWCWCLLCLHRIWSAGSRYSGPGLPWSSVAGESLIALVARLTELTSKQQLQSCPSGNSIIYQELRTEQLEDVKGKTRECFLHKIRSGSDGPGRSCCKSPWRVHPNILILLKDQCLKSLTLCAENTRPVSGCRAAECLGQSCTNVKCQKANISP